MSALKKGMIGAIVGAVVLTAFYVASVNGTTTGVDILTLLGCIPLGALYGFGYAFGWGYFKSITAKAMGVATGASILTILFSKEDTGLKIFFIYLFAFAFATAIAWLPGIVKGIASIVREHQTA